MADVNSRDRDLETEGNYQAGRTRQEKMQVGQGDGGWREVMYNSRPRQNRQTH